MEATTEQLVFQRELQIAATPETVWEFLVDPEKLARWKGGSAWRSTRRPGGGFRIEIIPGNIASGEFVELDRPHRLVYTWGWEPDADGPNAVPPGSSTSRSSSCPRTAARSSCSRTATCRRATSAESHARGWDHYLGRLAVAAAGGDPGPDPWLGGRAA